MLGTKDKGLIMRPNQEGMECWVDAATGSGVLGTVLAQHVHKTDETKIVPTHLDLDDPVHIVLATLTYLPVC